LEQGSLARSRYTERYFLADYAKEVAILEKRTKMFVLIFLIFALLALGILDTSGRVRVNSLKPSGQAPFRNVDITLAQDQHDQFFEQLRKFADKNALAIRISQTDPSGENFLVEMWSADIKMIVVDSGDPGLFLISFFNTSEERPVPESFFDEMVSDLESFISEIPNVTFSVKK
jgi:hypothetical protein